MKTQTKFWLILAATTAKLIYRGSQILGLGAGSHYPGKFILTFAPNILNHLTPRFKNGLILITGTNGKTTTTKVLVEILTGMGKKVVTNSKGANMISGILTSILTADLRLNEEFMADYAVFEIDEAVLIQSFRSFKPKILVITNFSRDQLDRYGEIDTIINKISGLIQGTDGYSCKVVLNGNDPNIARLGAVIKPEDRLFFGINEEITALVSDGIVRESASGGIGEAIETPELDIRANSIQTDYLNGSRFDLGYRDTKYGIHLKLPGVFNILNILAAAAAYMFTDEPNLINLPVILEQVKPSYGRSEHFTYQDSPIFLFLVKNPVGFNYIIQLLMQAPNRKRILLLLNDLSADGKDVSWIWDVAMENLWKVPCIEEAMASGSRAGDMGLRLKYSEPPGLPITVNYSPRAAFREIIGRLQSSEELIVLANYTAMISFRSYLVKIGGENL